MTEQELRKQAAEMRKIAGTDVPKVVAGRATNSDVHTIILMGIFAELVDLRADLMALRKPLAGEESK